MTKKSSSKPSKTRRTSSIRVRERIVGYSFLAPFAILFILVFAFPLGISIKAAFFKDVAEGGGIYGGGQTVNTFVWFENFEYVLTNLHFWQGMGRILLFGIIQVPLMIGSALLLALFLDSWLVRRPEGFRLAYFLPHAVPGIIAAMLWLYLYSPEISPIVQLLQKIGINVDFFSSSLVLGSMINITTWAWTGYNMLIFLAALQAIPRELYEAARMDGATGWQVVTKIKIPLVRNAALLTVLLSIIGTIQLFNEPMIMSQRAQWMGADYMPMMMAYSTMMGKMTPSGDGPAAAISIVMAVIAGLLAFIYALLQRKKMN